MLAAIHLTPVIDLADVEPVLEEMGERSHAEGDSAALLTIPAPIDLGLNTPPVEFRQQSPQRRPAGIHFDFLGFQFRARKIMWVKADSRIFAHSFQPAASPKALTRISRDIRSWALHHRSDKSLTELAQMYNPCIRGWISYYSHFYRTQLRPTLKRIDAYVIRWARRKFKRMRHQTKGARDWFDRLRRANPTLFAHWTLCHGNGRTSGAV
jgi:Group II intron, maturase-specific domain